MQIKNVPRIDAGYWIAILVASMCGANAGDYLARILGLGHANGLLPLALVFTAIVLAERWANVTTVLWYWLAIIVLRTGATNLADLATHDFKLNFQVVEAGLVVLLAACVIAGNGMRAASTLTSNTLGSVPKTDGWYWAAMLTAGTLGTVLGDDVGDNTPLGIGMGSIALLAVFAGVLATATFYGRLTLPWYWIAIVAARTAGTTMGDFLASRKGAALGLPLSLAITSALLAAVVILWSRSAARTQAA